jgi:hypothetical protein
MKCLLKHDVPFVLVVEPQERQAYVDAMAAETDTPSGTIETLPWRNRGLIAVRNWIKEHAIAAGAKRHWQLDDNIRLFRRLYRGRRIKCSPGIALRIPEVFVDRYTNIAIAGLNYEQFVRPGPKGVKPYYLNVHVYSCTLVLNSIPHVWRSEFNDDTDLCLQVLAAGMCTVLFNAFMQNKMETMTHGGGNTPIYQDDGRLKMSRDLERLWPGVVETKRRFGRPQHVIKSSWRKFDNKLIRRDDIDFDAFEPNEFGMVLTEVKPIQSPAVRELMEGEK